MLLYAASDLYNDPSWAGGFSNPELVSSTAGNRAAKWQAAKDAAKAVIDLGIYALHDTNDPTQDYIDVFLLKDTREDIFSRYFIKSRGWEDGALVFDNAVVSYNGDKVIHYNHPTWRGDRNDPATATRVDGKRVR